MAFRRPQTRNRLSGGLAHAVRHRSRRAFTILELLVAVTILLIMISIVGMILSSSRKLAKTAQGKMRANAAAAAIAEVLRDDVRRVTKNGFLCVTDWKGRPRLLLTAAGHAQSLTVSDGGTGEFLCYGIDDNQADSASKTNDILFRVGLILNDSPKLPTAGTDILNWDLSDLQMLPWEDVNSAINTVLLSSKTDALRVPPLTLAEVSELWKVVTTHCSNLSILWTDGEPDANGNLQWYGPAPGSPKDSNWSTRNVYSNKTEFNDGSGAYRALWTQRNQNNWPLAIKVRFQLRDPQMPPAFDKVDYDVICPVGQ